MSAKSIESIVEPIGHSWSDELVWLDLAGTAVVDAQSQVEYPSQTAGRITRHGLVEPAQLCVQINLAPDQILRLEAISSPHRKDKNPFVFSSDDKATITVTNGRIEMMIPASRPFDAGAAPGPVMALRAVGGGWIGRGTWGPSPFTGRIETRIIDRGPLYARWTMRYIVGGREIAFYDLRLIAGQDFVCVRDETLLDAGFTFRFELHGTDSPTRWCTYGGGELTDVIRGPIDRPPPPTGPQRPGELLHIDFHSGHFGMSYTWAGFAPDAGPMVGICEMNSGSWRNPGRNRIRVFRDADGLDLRFPVDGGAKEFALACGDWESFAPEKGLSRFCHIRRKYSDIPLDKVCRWVTRWSLFQPIRPLLYPDGTANRWKEKLQAWPELQSAYERLAESSTGDDQSIALRTAALLPCYLVSDDRRLRDAIFAHADRELRRGVDAVLTNGFLRLNIFHGRAIKDVLERLDVLRWRGEIDERRASEYARQIAFLSYCFADDNFWAYDAAFRDRLDPRSHGPQYWDDVGDAICPPNFTTEYFTSFALAALAYPEHPQSAAWIKKAEGLFERQLDAIFYESGGYIESVNYHDHLMQMLCTLAVALVPAGGRDFFEHAKFKATFGFFARMMTPAIALTDAGKEMASGQDMLRPTGTAAVMVTNWGNSGHDCSGFPAPPILAVAAGIYADRDPDYARLLMSAWRRSTRRFFTTHVAFNLVALGRPDLADIPTTLTSEVCEGLGVNMRANVGRSDEVFAWIKCGVATHHNCRDEGGLVLYAHGAPIIGDFGYWAQDQGQSTPGYPTWKHTCVTFGGKTTSGSLGPEVAFPPVLWRSTPAADLLVADLPVENVIFEHDAFLKLTRVPRIEHRRFILFLKPDIFVIYDHIPASTLPSTWWVHSLADEVQISSQSARFTGRFGVDLHIRVLLPSPARIEEGIFSVQRHLRIEHAGAGDYLVVLSARPKRFQGPSASYDPIRRLLKVDAVDRRHEVILSPIPFSHQFENGWQFDGRVALLTSDGCQPLDGTMRGPQ